MDRAPIFLYSSFRTGGSAFAMALKSNDQNMLFFDPLNSGLMNYEYARSATSETWNSNHPYGLKYFEEYMPIFVDGKLEYFPDLNEYRFRNSSKMFQEQLLRYLNNLMDIAHKSNKTPVFKFEQLEGHVELLRSHFPFAIHLGLIRNPKEQINSWLEQKALGESGFFNAASKLIQEDPEFFTKDRIIDHSKSEEVFEVYHGGLLRLRSSFDLTLNLYEDNREDFIGKVRSDLFKKIFRVAFKKLESLDQKPTFETKFFRMTGRSLELIQQRDELIQQRDELIQQRDELIQQRDELTQERDELTQQRDELVNSTIWRLSKPLRDLINYLKG